MTFLLYFHQREPNCFLQFGDGFPNVVKFLLHALKPWLTHANRTVPCLGLRFLRHVPSKNPRRKPRPNTRDIHIAIKNTTIATIYQSIAHSVK